MRVRERDGAGAATKRRPWPAAAPATDPLWYKDAVLYELRVRSFFDSNDDGVGDFPGLTQKLDYLSDLGVTTLWLLPFYPSPLRDDGYDIADYLDVSPELGTLQDFRVFLREAHARGLRVVTELVLNHTSDQHPWFQRARRAPPGSPYRDFYVWSDTPDRFREARIIFQDFENSNWAWDPVARAYYWHRFYSHQPDLNYDNPRVRRAILKVVDFWLGLGVDGLRLDAVPYLYEREGTSCENLPECHQFLKDLRRHIDARFPHRMLLAEANQWPEDAAAYFGDGDECHMAFHFPVMPRLFMALRKEDRFPIVDILLQTPPLPESCQWAMFLRNHDELTLEMVTDEERDYMYRVYAADATARINLGIRRRLAPLLGNDRKRIELMNALLFSLPGTPVIYYGDEIGMGDNFYLGDRNGVRTPMQWTPDRNAGFSRANPQRLFLPLIQDPEYSHETINVETQQKNPHSLLWWTKRLIALRKRYRAFGRGSLTLLYPQNPKVLAFVRRHGDETVLVVCNLSRFVQPVELDLAEFRGLAPVEMFGRTEFPPIRQAPYFLTLGPHSFYWFSLEPTGAATARLEERRRELPLLPPRPRWQTLLEPEGWTELETVLGAYLKERRWFAGKARRLKTLRIAEAVPLGEGFLVFLAVEYQDGPTETYVLPIAYAPLERLEETRRRLPGTVIAQIGDKGFLQDGLSDPAFARTLLEAIAGRRRLRGRAGVLEASSTRMLRRLWSGKEELSPSLAGLEQSNTSVVYGDRMFLKLLRRIEAGLHPELEIGRFLTERGFPHVPPVAGALEYRDGHGARATTAILFGYVANEGDAWRWTLDWLGQYLERALAAGEEARAELIVPPSSPLELAAADPPSLAVSLMGDYMERMLLLGQRTGELHLALAADGDPAFAPEPFTTLSQRSLYQSLRNLTGQVFRLLRSRLDEVPAALASETRRAAELEGRLLGHLRVLLERKLTGMRIRVHGDYHLGQVLYTGKDFAIIDFEGEPARPLSERRIKRSPLRDVAGMLRSFAYAAEAALPGGGGRSAHRPEDRPVLEPFARFWQAWAGAAFVRGYLATGVDTLLPSSPGDLAMLLDVLLIEKTIYELGYELHHRPEWLRIPVRALLARFEEGQG